MEYTKSKNYTAAIASKANSKCFNQSNCSLKSFYVVVKGRECGVFNNWQTCRAQVDNYENPIFRGFQVLADANAWFNDASIRKMHIHEINSSSLASMLNSFEQKMYINEGVLPKHHRLALEAYIADLSSKNSNNDDDDDDYDNDDDIKSIFAAMGISDIDDYYE